MGRKDRTGEERLNSFGSKMVIKEYRGAMDIDVYFPEYNWTSEHVQYSHFKNGKMKCPYEPRYCGKGYLGEGKIPEPFYSRLREAMYNYKVEITD